MKVFAVALIAFACIAAISARTISEDQFNYNEGEESPDALGVLSLARGLCYKTEIIHIDSSHHDIQKWFEYTRIFFINLVQRYRLCYGESLCLQKVNKSSNDEWRDHIRILREKPHGSVALVKVRDVLERCRVNNPELND